MPFLDSSKHIWRVWRANAKASLTREMEFRGNFILGIIRQLLWFIIFIIFIETLFTNTQAISGWSKIDMLIIVALSRLVEGAMGVLFINNWMNFTQAVNKGQFDYYLLKPVPVQFYTGFKILNIENIGNVFAGLGLLIYALIHVSNRPSAWMVLLAFMIIPIGIVIYHSLLVIVATLVFRLERLGALWGFNELFSEPLTVPFDVFPDSLRAALTYLLPIAFVVFVPAQALTGRLTWWQVPIGILIAVIFLLLANVAWRAGLKRYSSASS